MTFSNTPPFHYGFQPQAEEHDLKKILYSSLSEYQNRWWIRIIGIGVGTASALITLVARTCELFETCHLGTTNLFSDSDSHLGARQLAVRLPTVILHLAASPLICLVDIVWTTIAMLIFPAFYLEDRRMKYELKPFICL